MEENLHTAKFEEDHHLRSGYIRELTLRQLRGPAISEVGHTYPSDSIPRILVRYWHDFSDVPTDVRKCLDSWDALRNEGFIFQMFDDASAEAYIAERYGPRERAAFVRCRHPAMRCDYLRMCFMLAEGGLYVDADDVLLSDGWKDIFHDATLKVHPLCYDVRISGMVPDAEIRKPDLATDGRIFYVNNNPIAAPAGHPVLRLALMRATDALLGDDSAPEIQETTGPGNLTAALVAHARDLQIRGAAPDFEFVFDWEKVAEPCWDLEYRNDLRNWRNMVN